MMSHQFFKRFCWPFVLLLTAGLAGYTASLFSRSHQLGSFADDSVSYLLMAQCWSPYYPASEIIQEACQYEHYPPLLPLFLALTGLSHSLTSAHTAIALSLAIIILLVFMLATTYYPQQPALAYLCALLVAIMPASWINVLSILSENLYIILTLVILYYAQLPTKRYIFWPIFSLLILLLLTRTIGISLAGAILLRALLYYRDAHARNWGYATLGALFIAGIWYGLHSPGGEVRYETDLKILLHEIISGQRTVWDWVAPQLENSYQSWLSSFLIYWHSASETKVLIISGFGLLALISIGLRLWQRQIDGTYSLFYLAILAIWPYPGQIPRFLYAIAPVLILQAVYASWFLQQYYRPKFPLAYLILVMVFTTTLPATAFIYQRAQYQPATLLTEHFIHNPDFYRYADLATAEAISARHAYLQADMALIQQTTPATATIAWFTRSYLPYLAQRRMVPFPPYHTPAQFLRQLQTSKPDFIFLSHLHPRDTRPQTNGLNGYPLFKPFTQVIWQRQDDQGKIVSILLKVNHEQLATYIATQPPA